MIGYFTRRRPVSHLPVVIPGPAKDAGPATTAREASQEVDHAPRE